MTKSIRQGWLIWLCLGKCQAECLMAWSDFLSGPAFCRKIQLKAEINKVAKLSSMVEGNGNPGMLVGSLACDEVIRIAKENDFGIVGTRGSFCSSGSLTYYLEKNS